MYLRKYMYVTIVNGKMAIILKETKMRYVAGFEGKKGKEK